MILWPRNYQLVQNICGAQVGSCCSGWGVLEMVMEEFGCRWNEVHPNNQIKAGWRIFFTKKIGNLGIGVCLQGMEVEGRKPLDLTRYCTTIAAGSKRLRESEMKRLYTHYSMGLF